MIIVVDSDGLIGVSNEEDLHYQKSINISQELKEKNAQFIYPATTIAEAVTVLQVRLNKNDTADKILEFVKAGTLFIEPVDQAILAKAAIFLGRKRSKHATLFDAIVAIVAKNYNAEGIFSFDRFYKKQGFKLASEL